MMRKLAVFAASTLVGACAVGPDYERPDIETPEGYSEAIDEGASFANVLWWELFQDPELDRLIRIALEESRDLRAATARLDEAQAFYGFTKADLYPSLDIVASGQRGNSAEQFIPDAGIQNNFFVGLDLAWEIDLFGRLRRSNEAARAEILAAAEARRAVYISLVADVATAYFILLDLDNRYEITKRTLATRQDSTKIIRARFEQGTTPLIDVNQAEIQEAESMADLALFERQVRQAENLISVLIGRNPGPITRGNALEAQVLPPDVPAGLPSELLQRRPDVLSAEASLAAQTARIGVAQALRWPSLSLTGSAGAISNELSGLNDGDGGIFNISANLFQPLFNAGRNKQRVEVEKARTEQLLNAYELTVLQAFREVEDSLIAIRTYRAESAARDLQTFAASNAAVLSRARYNGGVTSYLEVLDIERSLFNAEISASATRRARLESVVALYKALGGGWVEEEEEEN